MARDEKLGALRQHYGFPERRPEFKPFYWSLDGGGRETIIEAATNAKAQVILEVGVFLGGSALQWLRAIPDVFVIGVDRYGYDCADFYRRFGSAMPAPDLSGMTEAAFVEQLERDDAQYLSVVSNLWEYRDRFIPIRGSSPSILQRLHTLGLKPDVCYLDTDKTGSELEVFRELWPDSVICGDDWNYETDEGSGVFDIRQSVIPFANKHRLEVHAIDASWVLRSPARKSFLQRLRG